MESSTSYHTPRTRLAASAALALLLYAALADLAIETQLASSPLRLYVWIILTTYAGVTGLLWRRMQWADHATASASLLLIGVAVTAWFPGGHVLGVRAAGAPTPVLLCAICAGGIALGSFVLVRVAPYLWAKALIGVLGAYGVAAFAETAFSSSPPIELFRGRGFWRWLPMVLQGGPLGVFAIVSAALLLSLAQGASQLRAGRQRAWITRSVALCATLAIASSFAVEAARRAGWLLEDIRAGLTLDAGPEISAPLAIDEVQESAERIDLFFESLRSQPANAQIRWRALDAELLDDDSLLEENALLLSPGARAVASLAAPDVGFGLGNYRVDVALERGEQASLEFRVVPDAPLAEILSTATEPLPRGINVARSALGGRVDAPSIGDNSGPANLIDGRPFAIGHAGLCLACGWVTYVSELPADATFSFSGDAEAEIEALAIDPRSWGAMKDVTRIAKHLEIWAMDGADQEAESLVTSARLQPVLEEQLIRFEPVRARAIRLRVLSGFGRGRVEFGEVKILESPESDSIIRPHQRNLVMPQLGGTAVRFTSQDSRGLTSALIDGRDAGASGWRSGATNSRHRSYLPQEFIFAFREGRPARIDRLFLAPWEGRSDDSESRRSWPRLVSVAVSDDGRLRDFEEIGRFSFDEDPSPQEIPIDRPARFLRLRILENHGADHTSLGRVEILERPDAEDESLLVEYLPRKELRPEARKPGAESPEAPAAGDGEAEREPNDSRETAEAISPGVVKRGLIEPPTEVDHFALRIPGPEPQSLSIELWGLPVIQTNLSLLGPEGEVLGHFDPGQQALSRTALTWRMDPGPVTLALSRPPTQLVLVWDTSGSMEGHSEVLREAVYAFIRGVRPTERMNLIRFGDREVEVLLSHFSIDPEELLAAAPLRKFNPVGGTPLFDAIDRAVELLEGAPGDRAIIVMSDGADSGSQLPYPDFWNRLLDSGVRLYTVGLGWGLEDYVEDLASTGERVLAYTAKATGGGFHFTRSSADLPAIFEQIASELQSPASYALRASVGRGLGRLQVVSIGEPIPSVSAPSRIVLVLDASGSMKRSAGQQPRIEVASQVLDEVIQDLPESSNVGLRVFGHRIREGQEGDCLDSELVYPFGPLDRARLRNRLHGIRALGTTPIAYSIDLLADDFAGVDGEKFVVLVTDGKEECGGDMEAALERVQSLGVELTLNVVGFAVSEADAVGTFTRLARRTSGSYFEAADAEGLKSALGRALSVPYDVLDGSGESVASGRVGDDPIALLEGTYSLAVRTADGPLLVPDVRVEPDRLSRVELENEGQEIGAHVNHRSARVAQEGRSNEQ